MHKLTKTLVLLLAALSLAPKGASAGSVAPSLAELASFAGDAYAFTRNPKWKIKEGCSVALETKRTDACGFQAIAFLCGGQLVISYTGTKFTEKDEFDFAADRALVKITQLSLTLMTLQKARERIAKKDWKAEPKSGDFTYEALAAKMHEAESFFEQAVARTKIARTSVFVTGHSLGGFLAEYIGGREGVITHAFNPAPGARTVLGKSAKGDTVTAHHRNFDLVSGGPNTRQAHLGKMCAYSDPHARNTASDAANQLDAHSIEAFAKDLSEGLKPTKCE